MSNEADAITDHQGRKVDAKKKGRWGRNEER